MKNRKKQSVKRVDHPIWKSKCSIYLGVTDRQLNPSCNPKLDILADNAWFQIVILNIEDS